MTNARTARTTREKAAALRAEAARREARRRSMIVTAAVATVLVVVVAAFVLVRNASQGGDGGDLTPAGAAATGSIVVGRASAPVTVTAYEDFQCPVCKQFEEENAGRLDQWVQAGTVKIDYRPIAFLDRASSDEYSTRALNAAAVVADKAPAGFARFHAALYAAQPAEGGPGLTDDRLVQLATDAGVPEATARQAIENRSYADWTKRVTEAASKAGITGTPTVQVNGRTIAQPTAANLAAAVEAAAKG